MPAAGSRGASSVCGAPSVSHASQLSEEARVVRAEEMAVAKAKTKDDGIVINEEPILNDEYIYSETISLNDEDGC